MEATLVQAIIHRWPAGRLVTREWRSTRQTTGCGICSASSARQSSQTYTGCLRFPRLATQVVHLCAISQCFAAVDFLIQPVWGAVEHFRCLVFSGVLSETNNLVYSFFLECRGIESVKVTCRISLDEWTAERCTQFLRIIMFRHIVEAKALQRI